MKIKIGDSVWDIRGETYDKLRGFSKESHGWEAYRDYQRGLIKHAAISSVIIKELLH